MGATAAVSGSIKSAAADRDLPCCRIIYLSTLWLCLLSFSPGEPDFKTVVTFVFILMNVKCPLLLMFKYPMRPEDEYIANV